MLKNFYAPSRAAHLADRKVLFNTEILDLSAHTPTDMIIAGDFNCVISSADWTGHCNRSRSLERIIQGLDILMSGRQQQRDRCILITRPLAQPVWIGYTSQKSCGEKTRGKNHTSRFYRPSSGDATS